MHQVRHQPELECPSDDFSSFLLKADLVSARALLAARNIQVRSRSSLDRILISEGLLTAHQVATALSRFHGLPRADLATDPPDPGLADTVPLRLCLNHSVLPWRRIDDTLVIAASRVEDFTHVLSILGEDAPRAELAFAPASDIQAALARQHRATLTARASARVPAGESCRGWGRSQRRRLGLTIVALIMLMGLTWAQPVLVFAALSLWAAFTLIVAAGLRLAAYVARMSDPAPETLAIGSPPPETVTDLPRVSVLVPLFKETEIARHLIARLSRLTYPKPLLDVVLVLEENDHLTRDTIAACTLPPWMRVVEVPEGQPKTKPRAMNYGLDFCDGDIVGIWDAEDAPDPDQITRVVERFAQAPSDVACLQGVLDYYNSRQNWLARCFSVEYAAWFRLILPGMERLGLAIPLGGTTCFFRRDVLEEMGGWDAHNVTEDADLGFRLARHGYRTEVIPTTTGEEANCRFWPWIRQRSRWLKGYMVTYLVHMRRPLTFYRQMGHRRFWGFQAHFVTALSQFVLAPFLWSFWLVLLGLPHPLDPLLPRQWLVNFGLLFLMVEVITILINATAVAGRKHRHLLPWVPTLHFYYPLGAVAAYKALYELIVVPFYWDKTQHGHSLHRRKVPAKPEAELPAFRSRRGAPVALAFRSRRVKLEPGHERL
ncbi:glycosyltransferase [Marimonas arenosa]|uniref:Glycosyltransferase n=1 Tax=Marimonas arenosa TaxID=1795305 RepID=A0AAE3WFD2_9RHOB|nr:glycosyltransferase [Marimonas arenosa]MDQ2091674.1 glycosyltransferase [Marimonas arenosa]